MNTMPSRTNNTVKSMNISETSAVVMDDSTLSWILLVIAVIGFIAAMSSPVGCGNCFTYLT